MAHKTVRLELELDAELSVYCNLPDEGGYTMIGNLPPHPETDDSRTVHPGTETDGFRNVHPEPGEQESAYPDFTAMRGEGCIVICRTGARPQGCIITAGRTAASDGREAQINTSLRWMGRIPDLHCFLLPLRDEANRLAGEKIREWEGSAYDSEAKGLPRNAPEDDRMQENRMQTLTLQAEPLKGEPSEYLLAEMLSAAENRHPCVILESAYSWNEFVCALACLLDAAEQEEGRSLSIGYAPPEGAGLMDINYWPASRNLDREVKCRVRQIEIVIPERGKSYAEPEYTARAKELIYAYNSGKNSCGSIRNNPVRRSAVNHDTAAEHQSESGNRSSCSRRSACRRRSTSENRRSSGRGSSSERKPTSGRGLSFRGRLSAAAGPMSLSCCIALTTLILAVCSHSSSGMIVLFEDGSELASLAVGCVWGYLFGTLLGPHRK